MKVYSSHVFDKDGNDVTGSINNSDIKIHSNAGNVTLGSMSNKLLYFSDSSNIEFPRIVNRHLETRELFGKTTEVLSYNYYAAYGNFTINGVSPRSKNNKRLYYAPQGVAVDPDNGDYYVSFNMGSIPSEIENGGPQRTILSGVQNEWVNVLPIIKFNNAGSPQGIEYIIGGSHEGFMSIWYDSVRKEKRLGVCAYPHGVGTRNNDKKPDGFDPSWDSYYYIGNDASTYYSFSVEGRFNSSNRDDEQLFHAKEYGGNGIILDKEFDVKQLNAPNNSEVRVDPYRHIAQVTSSVKPNVFKFNPSGGTNNFKPVEYLNIENIRQDGDNAFQSACIRGGHIYGSFGGQNDIKRPEIRASIINGGNELPNNQSLVDVHRFTNDEINDFWETEGCWVDEKEENLWFIVKWYDGTDNQKSTMKIFKTELHW